MGLLSFVKEAGEKIWDSVSGHNDAAAQNAKVQEHLKKTGIPDADKVQVQVDDGKATVTGQRRSFMPSSRKKWRGDLSGTGKIF